MVYLFYSLFILLYFVVFYMLALVQPTALYHNNYLLVVFCYKKLAQENFFIFNGFTIRLIEHLFKYFRKIR